MDPAVLREKGDWIAQLKKILQLGPDDQRDYGTDPKSQHRSTKKAVKLLLSNLRSGAKKNKDGDTTDQDIEKVVFNAVDPLITDKTDKSKSGKTKLEALAKFKTIFDQEFNAQAGKKKGLGNEWQDRIDGSLRALKQEAMAECILGSDVSTNELAQFGRSMLDTDEGKYIAAKCQVMADYGLISADLVSEGAKLQNAVQAKDDKTIKSANRKVRKAIDNCHDDLKEPLTAGLVDRFKP